MSCRLRHFHQNEVVSDFSGGNCSRFSGVSGHQGTPCELHPGIVEFPNAGLTTVVHQLVIAGFLTRDEHCEVPSISLAVLCGLFASLGINDIRAIVADSRLAFIGRDVETISNLVVNVTSAAGAPGAAHFHNSTTPIHFQNQSLLHLC